MKKVNNKIKRGQITVFIIIAIVVVVLIGIILIITKNNFNTNNTNDESYNYVRDCLRQTGEQALYYIGDMGGYYHNPLESTDYGIPYYFYLNKNIMPSKGSVENETSMFIDNRGVLCGYFDDPQVSVISKGKVSTKTKIYDDKVVIDVKYPITIEKANKKISYENFNIEIPGRVGILYKATEEYMQGQVNNPGGICISCINDIANKYDVKFVTYNYDNETVIFNLYDNNTKINNQSFYVYTFAVKYDLNVENVSI